jgi:hypothetical protein
MFFIGPLQKFGTVSHARGINMSAYILPGVFSCARTGI